MPGIEDWKTKPYMTIQQIFEDHKGDSHETFVKSVEEYFSQRLSEETLRKLPSVNSLPLEQLRSGTVVKYRCMVQDVFDPQFFASRYTVTGKDGATSREGCASFRDVPDLGPDETIDFGSHYNVTAERQGFYCVPIPGESSWVKAINDKQSRLVVASTSLSSNAREKRGRDDDESELESEQKAVRESGSLPVPDPVAQERNSDLRQHQVAIMETEGSRSKASTNLPNLNMPLPEEKGVPCIVRVYSNNVELKATDAVEVVGVLCMDPRLASVFDANEESNDIAEKEELQAHEPPASLVPRLHALVIRRLQHNNPILPINMATESYKKAVSQLMEDSGSIRIELLSILEHALLGDRLAAEYLLCHLISCVYARVDVLPLGKLCVNMSGCPCWPRYTKFLHHLISQLTTQSVLLDMSIEKMNSVTLVPKKDYSQNRITAGMLQLSSGTSLVVDETALEQGQLSARGVNNVKALADVIKWQRVEYDFQWHPIPVQSDINVLVLSEGESLLPKDIHVPLSRPQQEVDVGAHFARLDARLTEENLAKLRAYISVCRLMEYTVAEETQKMIQEDFVQTRQGNPNNMSVEDFQALLGLVRLICVSHGMSSPTVDMWRAAKTMEENRKARVAQLPASNRRSL